MEDSDAWKREDEQEVNDVEGIGVGVMGVASGCVWMSSYENRWIRAVGYGLR